MINSYPTVYALGHKAIQGIFNGPVVIEEKVDGSQFSFGIVNGELMCRSHNAQILVDNPNQMFERAVDAIKQIESLLHPGWIYRGEYLQKPKHNTLVYGRVPQNYIIGFDIACGMEDYLTPEQKRDEFTRIGLEVVPLVYEGVVSGMDMLSEFLGRVSVLGNSKIEGVVVKNYALFTEDKKVAMGKFVSEHFKEVHNGDWKSRNPSRGDFVESLIGEYKTEARWVKSVQHLDEEGLLDHSPKDIGLLMKSIGQDVRGECADEIKERLFRYFWPIIQRGITAGMPEWYKRTLAESAFEQGEVTK